LSRRGEGKRKDMRRLLVGALAAVVLLGPGQPASAQTVPYPDSMAATGDSITRAFNSGVVPWTEAPWNSWSTGSSGIVRSHYRRILAANPGILLRNFNDARSGAKMAELSRQVALVNLQHVEYVTVLMGANDACASSAAAMTPVAEFRAQYEAALGGLAAGSPQAYVYVVSIPDVYHLWALFHEDPRARFAWRLTGFCKSMLTNPGSTSTADEARRQRVRQRIVDYNAVLADGCALYVRCHFDGNAVFDYRFETKDVSKADYFHPSREGQRVLAAVTWEAGFDFVP
jgi:lysophospholipase L1-like esterase